MATFTTWQQNVEYDARKDRAPISELFGEGVLDLSGGSLAVSERSAGANMSVDVAAGRCVVDGDEQADQETYLAVFDDSTNLSVASADPDNPRKDRVIVRVEDSAVSGTSDGPVREVLTGTAGSSPSAPAVPDSAISLAIIDVAAGTASITDANITDDRSEGSAGGEDAPLSDHAATTGQWTIPGWWFNGTSNSNIATGRFVMLPVFVAREQSFDRIRIEITSAGDADTNARLGIYNATDGSPTDLRLDAGTVPVDSTGAKDITINETLPAGIYFLAFVTDSTTNPQLLGIDATSGVSIPVSGSTPNAGQATSRVVRFKDSESAQVGNGLSDPAPTPDGLINPNVVAMLRWS